MPIIQDVHLIDPQHPLHGKRLDVRITEGVIRDWGEKLFPKDGEEVWEEAGLCVSSGWVDLFAQTGDPGLEHREDFASAARAALAGGFTAIAVLPNTAPAADSKAAMNYIGSQSKNLPVDFLPIGAISQKTEGKNLAELYDMHYGGAVAFSDGKKSITDDGLLLRALEYLKPLGGLIIHSPVHNSLIPGGQMHEGQMSTMLGLRGIPAEAEEMLIRRDLALMRYTQARLHIANVSCAGGVALLRQAKEQGLRVTASVSALNLFFTDEALFEFDSHLKVLPPLRTEKDRLALQEGLKDGTIDAIHSNHVPYESEAKLCEFTYASFGAIGLETTFAAARTMLKGYLSLEQLVDKLTAQPRRILGLPNPLFQVGELANLTFFQPDMEWQFTEAHIRSKSHNTPFIGSHFTGQVRAVAHQGKFFRKEHL